MSKELLFISLPEYHEPQVPSNDEGKPCCPALVKIKLKFIGQDTKEEIGDHQERASMSALSGYRRSRETANFCQLKLIERLPISETFKRVAKIHRQIVMSTLENCHQISVPALDIYPLENESMSTSSHKTNSINK